VDVLGWVTGLVGVLTGLSAVAHNRWVTAKAKRDFLLDVEERHLRDRTADAAASQAAASAMALVSEQVAMTAYGCIDRLRADMDRLQAQAAEDRLVYERTIMALREQVAVLDNEVRVLRGQLDHR
jgi:hypothetical protein